MFSLLGIIWHILRRRSVLKDSSNFNVCLSLKERYTKACASGDITKETLRYKRKVFECLLRMNLILPVSLFL
jgi:hypothetical protein